jgi:hypothetical protein
LWLSPLFNGVFGVWAKVWSIFPALLCLEVILPLAHYRTLMFSGSVRSTHEILQIDSWIELLEVGHTPLGFLHGVMWGLKAAGLLDYKVSAENC